MLWANLLEVKGMAEKRIGVAVTAADSNTALAVIEDLEKRGFPASSSESF